MFVVKLVEIGPRIEWTQYERIEPFFFPSLAWMISVNLSLGPSECIPGVGTWIRLCFSTLIVVCSRVSYQLPHWDLLICFPSSWHKFWLLPYKAADLREVLHVMAEALFGTSAEKLSRVRPGVCYCKVSSSSRMRRAGPVLATEAEPPELIFFNQGNKAKRW